ncbi:MAG: RsmB/NOP family class I SAM-dependent RNA methyltransferase [Anaerolineaceae bacterium]
MSKPKPDPPEPLSSPLDRYKGYLSPEDYLRLLAVSREPANTAIRVNLLKTNQPDEDIQRWQSRYGWSTKPLPFCPAGRQLLEYATPPSQTLEHRLGYYYIQDAASMLPVALFSPLRKGGLTLDMAASPGGKTTQLTDSTLDHEFVLANDSSASRLQALKIVMQTWGALNFAITNYPGEKLGDWFPEVFDRVLLDAPCSMESLRASPSHPHRPITVSERARLASRQLGLLKSAVKAARVGSEIVYSTCTMAPEEDEAVLSAFIDSHPGVVRVEASPAVGFRAPGLTQFEGVDFDPQVENSLRAWPHLLETNGFFAAKLVKLNPLPASDLVMPSRPFAGTGLVPLTPTELTLVGECLQSLYAFNLKVVLEEYQLQLFRREQNIFFLPVRYLRHFASLPYYALGTPAGRLFGTKFEVSADFVSRFGDQFTSNVWTIPEELVEDWVKGSGLRNLSLEDCQKGSIVAVRDALGRNLGAGKNLPGRLRNLLPNRSIKLV